ncbi:IS110 family transposase [Ectothiorhodospira haloalkaliphila]|uniref:IS110 family transposase n=1 Tax=Ectothiorhodospira haloalkaliphila TaxID=421628 RepID=UPI001EE9046D|nr:IS110 family transposase [Ectothiorhodospira haloalkaliphila]MCG5525949.1 IS110 family transposase [Ectothiorhodospira haloalkaliphila]
MDITPIHHRVIGLDVHQNKITACALIEQADGSVTVEHREFGGFKRDRRGLAEWVDGFTPDIVVMESTGIYWKSPYAALEKVGIAAWVVNARHVKNVPGRKTDISDAQWLATLARAGLVRASFIPPADIRHLRLIARQRQKLGGILASEKNRLHKVLADAGIRLNVLVSDLHGQSARAMVKALLADEPIHAILDRAGRLRATREDLFDALQPEELSAKHRFVLDELMAHIEYLEATMARFEQELLNGLAPWELQMRLLETVPGIDRLGAAMLLVEIGTDIDSFGSAERLASWVGICPGNNESAGKRKNGRTRKGNAWVRRLLCEFAQAASRTRCALKDKFSALSIRKGHKRSIVALAHKMLRIVYAMLTHSTPYQDRNVDYEALMVGRNAPRWLKMLAKHGYIATA